MTGLAYLGVLLMERPLEKVGQTSATTTPPDWQAAASGDLLMWSIHKKKTEAETEPLYGPSMDCADPHIP